MKEDPISDVPIGPQAAAAAAVEVDAVPDDGTATVPGAAPGASPGAAPSPDENIVAWKETLVMALAMLTGYAASRWPAMATSKEEIDAVSSAWAPVCAKRWPIATTPEIAAALVTAGVFAPKIVNAMGEEKRAKAQRAAEKRAAEAAERVRADQGA